MTIDISTQSTETSMHTEADITSDAILLEDNTLFNVFSNRAFSSFVPSI